jgi:hypothetical protein
VPEKAARLKRKFPKVEVHCFALSEDEGETSFFIDDRRSGYSSLANNGGREIIVQKKRLSAIVPSNDVDVIKLDVEGAELGVLIGGEDVVKRCRPIIMFESGPSEVLGYTKRCFWNWFSTIDYRVFTPNRLVQPDGGGGLGLDAFLDCHLYPFSTLNYFAVPAERLAEARERGRSVI